MSTSKQQQENAVNLDDMLNKITSYDKTLSRHNYKSNGSGVKPWSIRYTHDDGSHVDTRNSDWTYYDANGVEVEAGKDADSLDVFLSGF